MEEGRELRGVRGRKSDGRCEEEGKRWKVRRRMLEIERRKVLVGQWGSFPCEH